MEVSRVILEGQHVRLEPLSQAHEESLIAAAGDGELWNSTVTIVPSRATMPAYIASALDAQAEGRELPFVIMRKSSGQVVGSTRFYCIEPDHRRVEIGSTWLAASANRLLNATNQLKRLATDQSGVSDNSSRTVSLSDSKQPAPISATESTTLKLKGPEHTRKTELE